MSIGAGCTGNAFVNFLCVFAGVRNADVSDTFYTIVFEPLTKMLHISEVLIRAIPLCIIALGISVAYRSGIINIGAEGQMAMGLLAFTGVALAFPDIPRPLLLPVALIANFAGYSIGCCALALFA